MNLKSHKLVFYSFLLCVLSVTPVLSSDFSWHVVQVVDGDTLVVNNGSKQLTVELAGIDAPEINQPYGGESKVFVEKMVDKQNLKLSIANEGGQLLSEVYILRGGMRCLNRELVKNGFAWSLDNKNASVERIARMQKVGLWSVTNSIKPKEFRERDKMRIVQEEERRKAEEKRLRDEDLVKNYDKYVQASDSFDDSASSELSSKTEDSRKDESSSIRQKNEDERKSIAEGYFLRAKKIRDEVLIKERYLSNKNLASSNCKSGYDGFDEKGSQLWKDRRKMGAGLSLGELMESIGQSYLKCPGTDMHLAMIKYHEAEKLLDDAYETFKIDTLDNLQEIANQANKLKGEGDVYLGCPSRL